MEVCWVFGILLLGMFVLFLLGHKHVFSGVLVEMAGIAVVVFVAVFGLDYFFSDSMVSLSDFLPLSTDHILPFLYIFLIGVVIEVGESSGGL